MFWKKKPITENSGPTSVPALVGSHVVAEMQKNPVMSDHWVKYKCIMRPHKEGNSTSFDIRVYDEWETDQKSVKVTNFASLDGYPELVQFEGWFDKSTKKVQLKARQTAPQAAAQPAAQPAAKPAH